jgi:predicted Zn-dependent peptidase
MDKQYTPQNVVVAIAGNIGEDSSVVLEKIRAAFNNFAIREVNGKAEGFSKYVPAFVKREKDIEQVHLCLCYPGIKSGTDDTYTMAALNTWLGGGMSSRLFQKVREEHGLAYSVYSYHTSFTDTGLFAVYAALNPAQIGDVMDLVLEEIHHLNENPLTERQLTKIKEQLKSSYILSLESVSNRMTSIGRSQLMLNKFVTADELIQKIDDINTEAFSELCSRVFKQNQMSLAIVGNTDFEYSG